MSITLDLHGYTSCEGVREIQKTIVLNPKCNCIEVIHGFNNGSSLKRLLENKINIHSKRVKKTLAHPFNPGRTLVFLNII